LVAAEEKATICPSAESAGAESTALDPLACAPFGPRLIRIVSFRARSDTKTSVTLLLSSVTRSEAAEA
jgi:hypothetical protein